MVNWGGTDGTAGTTDEPEIDLYRGGRIARLLDYPGCTRVIEEAMAALSKDTREQPLRQIIEIEEGRLFGLMPGRAPHKPVFGAKLISVYHDPDNDGRSMHKGVVALFESEKGSLHALAEAHTLTQIRTACASAVATRALARDDAKVLAIFGCGTQAESHIKALRHLRPYDRVLVWGRSRAKAERLINFHLSELPLPYEVIDDAEEAASQADIICTVTSASEPILMRDWVKPGTHINAVGSSHAGPVEIDPELVAASRYIVDYKPSALAAAAEFLRAKELGLIDDDHIAGEIGEVLNGDVAGRENDEQITIYKSLGHIAQDLAALYYIHDKNDGFKVPRRIPGI